MRGRSAVGAEISGPALPRFTSGSCNGPLLLTAGGYARTTTARRTIFTFGLSTDHQNSLSTLYWASQCSSRLHNCYYGSRASSPPQMRKLRLLHVIQTARQRYCALAKLGLCIISPLCTTCFTRVLVAIVYAQHCDASHSAAVHRQSRRPGLKGKYEPC